MQLKQTEKTAIVGVIAAVTSFLFIFFIAWCGGSTLSMFMTRDPLLAFFVLVSVVVGVLTSCYYYLNKLKFSI